MSEMTTDERLHWALALLHGLEFGKTYPLFAETCPCCGWPAGGHDGTCHEPGCSLEAVLTGVRPERIVDLERRHGDAGYGVDGRDRRRLSTPVVEAGQVSRLSSERYPKPLGDTAEQGAARVVEVQPDDTKAAVALLLRASQLHRYTIQMMGEKWPVVDRYEVIHAKSGDIHAVVHVTNAGTLRVTKVNPRGAVALRSLGPVVPHE